jgi:hypothetical protein
MSIRPVLMDASKMFLHLTQSPAFTGGLDRKPFSMNCQWGCGEASEARRAGRES